MTQNSPFLALPLLAAGQAQKHVTHNEALMRLDAIVQLVVLDKDLATPPAPPSEGLRYVVPPGATGAWSGKTGQIALFQDGFWQFLAPSPGWISFVADEGALYVFDGSQWKHTRESVMAGLSSLGINTAASATDRLAVKANASLFSHDDVTPGSGDMRVKVNKSAPATTASLLFQSAYQGRAEVGLTGDDNFHVKVSSNGTTWKEAAIVRGSDGEISLLSAAVRGAAGTTRSIKFATDNTLRWEMGCTSAAESGSNAGSGFFLNAFDDTGTYVGTPMSVSRNGLKVSFPWAEFSANGPIFYREILPSADNALALGSSTKRWSTVYAASGVITTSDARYKRDIAPCPLGLDFVLALAPRIFRHASVGPQTGAPERHLGLIAQDVKAALEKAGVPCGIWVGGKEDEPQGLRYEEFIAPLIGAIQTLARRVEALEAPPR